MARVQVSCLPNVIDGRRELLITATVRGKPVAFLTTEEWGTAITSLRELYVAPAFRGQGVARRMLATLIRRARTNRTIEELWVSPRIRNRAARQFYRRHGFVVDPKGDGFGKVVPMVLVV